MGEASAKKYRVFPGDGVTVQVWNAGRWITYRRCATPGQAVALLAKLRSQDPVK